MEAYVQSDLGPLSDLYSQIIYLYPSQPSDHRCRVPCVRQASSNPTQTKHRLHATKLETYNSNKGLKKRTGPDTLTESAIAAHNDEMEDDREGSTVPVSGPIGASSDIFAQVRLKWNSPLESDKEMCAVLAAVSELVAEKQTGDSPVVYWTALMSTLEATDLVTDEKAVSAIVSLLAIVTPQVPQAVSVAHFEKASSVLVGVLQACSGVESQPIVRGALSCLTSLLLSQTASFWPSKAARDVFSGILAFTLDSRPKVRKVAQSGVRSLVQTCGRGCPDHPAVVATASFCLSQISGSGDIVLRALNLLRDVLPFFPVISAKTACERLLRLLTRGEHVTYVVCMEVLSVLFEATELTMPQDLLAKIVEALYEVFSLFPFCLMYRPCC